LGSAVTYVSKILKEVDPTTLPAEQPTKFVLVIKLKTAKCPRVGDSPVPRTEGGPGD